MSSCPFIGHIGSSEETRADGLRAGTTEVFASAPVVYHQRTERIGPGVAEDTNDREDSLETLLCDVASAADRVTVRSTPRDTTMKETTRRVTLHTAQNTRTPGDFFPPRWETDPLKRFTSVIAPWFMSTSFHLEQRFARGTFCTFIAPISRISTNTAPFLPSRYTSTQPLPPPNLGGQHRDGAFARHVLRNQDEHRRAGLLWPFPSLLHIFLRNFIFYPAFLFTSLEEPLGQIRHSPHPE